MSVRHSAWILAAVIAAAGVNPASATDVLMFKSEQGTITMDQGGNFNTEQPADTPENTDDSAANSGSGFSLELTEHHKEYTHGEGTGNEQGVGTIKLLSFGGDATTTPDTSDTSGMGGIDGITGVLPLDDSMLSATGPGSVAGGYDAGVAGDVADGLKARNTRRSGTGSNTQVDALTGDISSQISAGGYANAADGGIGMAQGVVQGGAADMVSGYLP